MQMPWKRCPGNDALEMMPWNMATGCLGTLWLGPPDMRDRVGRNCQDQVATPNA